MPLIPAMLRRPERDPEGAMTLVEHLEELRRRLFIAIGAIAIGAIVGWFLYNPLLKLMTGPYCDWVDTLKRSQRPPAGCRLIATGAIDPVMVKLKVVAVLGLFIALPIVLYQLWAFIVPGLTKRERRMAIPFVSSSLVLFALGALVAYLTLPKALGFLLGFAGPSVTPFLTANSFLSFVLLVALAFGVTFEFPIVLIFLTIVGILTSQKLRDWRRPAILIIAIAAAVITPSADPYSMLAMMLPMILFYEAAIIVARMMKK
ncbi:MAG: twin-arginine translocase subunit TatC [Actinomycetota bacterium]